MKSTLNGFSKKEIKNLSHYVCPNCDRKHLEISWGDDGWTCPYNDCKHHINIKIKDKDNIGKYFGKAYRKKTVLTCATCGEEIICYEGNKVCIGMSIHSYMCYRCNSYVALKYKNQYLQPNDCLSINWNKDIFNRFKKVNDDVFCIDVKTKKDFIQLRLLQHISKKEEEPFKYGNEKANNFLLFFTKRNLIGYIIWNNYLDYYTKKRFKNDENCLNVIFIKKYFRKKGIGTDMVKYWIENYGLKDHDKFIIEKPNSKVLKILIKLKYAIKKEENIEGINCSFFR